MTLSEFELRRIQHILTRYCESRVPPRERRQLRVEYRVKGNVVWLREYTPHPRGRGRWLASRTIELRFDPECRTWSAYAPDASGRRHGQALLSGWEHLEDLLDQLSVEPTAIVWG